MHSTWLPSVRRSAACVLAGAALFVAFSAPSLSAQSQEAAPAATAPAGALVSGAAVPSLSELKSAVGSTFVTKDDYRLAARDLVQFQIFEEPDAQTLQRVSAAGEISVPMLGTVRVGGLTLREAERLLAKAYLELGYFIKPQVILSVQVYAPRSVSVLGQVNKPEQIEFPVERETLGIVQAITLAGGFTRVAKVDGVRVLRMAEGKEEQFTINIAAYLDSKSGTEFKLLPDDIVYVPERVF